MRFSSCIRCWFVLLLFVLLPGCCAAAAPHPNVVLMMADDMGLGDTSAYQDFTGNADADQIHTPAMERLANMGVRFTDAHTPSTRCSPTRYGLLTGRYPWRNRLKHWVLFGAQGDPMIERDRPTLATLLKEHGYGTGMVGKWHVGLRYRRTDGKPAAGWEDADLTQPLYDTPLDHGFDYCRFTSRSHGTSGPKPADEGNQRRRNSPGQSVGPGHIHGRTAVGATGKGKMLVEEDADAYVLTKLGSRHSDHAAQFMDDHLTGNDSRRKPFFLYYACNSNHTPYTPDDAVGGSPVKGASRSVAGKAMKARHDFIYENDVVLGRLLDYFEAHDDPRWPGHKLIENTIVIFTSDNGAERDSNVATGPFRSNKGSVFEGGHRVPFLVAWPVGGVGDGDAGNPGRSNDSLIGLQDVYATLSEVLGAELPDLRAGGKGAEDSASILSAWRGGTLPPRPMFFNDHKQAKDHAAAALRLDDPRAGGRTFPGKWKLFFDASLLRKGETHPIALFDLATDPREENDRLKEEKLQPLVEHLAKVALRHRTSGGHRIADTAPGQRVIFDWTREGHEHLGYGTFRIGVAETFAGGSTSGVDVTPSVKGAPPVTMMVTAARGERELADRKFSPNLRGLGVSGGQFDQVENGEAILIRFDRDVLVESAAIVAGNGACGGFYRMGDHAPLAIYCVDADVDSNDQSGILSDLGVLVAGETLRLDSAPHYGVETPGQWRLGALTVRVFD